MNKLSRKELKTDHFVEEVQHSVEYVSSHRKPFVWAGIAGVVALVAGLGVYLFLQSGKAKRQEALGKAYAIQQSTFGASAPGAPPAAYPTAALRDAAAQKSFSEVAAQYPTSEEGLIAKYFLAGQAANQAKWAEAEKLFKEVSDSASKETASLAKFGLSQVYAAQNKTADAEKLLRALADNPTTVVSKDQAQLSLARVLVKSNPTEAKKLLETLKAGPSAVSRAALTAQAEIK
jgi:hypothetical protein